MTTNKFFGDSMTFGANNGSGPTDPIVALWPYIVVPWPHVLCAMRSEAIDVKAASGNTVADQALLVYAYTPAASIRHFYLAGKADQVAYGGGTNAVSQFQKTLSALAYWLAGSKTLATAAGWSFTGTWNTDTLYGGLGKFTQQNGATASFSISGDVLAFEQTLNDGNNATISLKVDGVLKATYPCVGDQTISRGGSTPIYASALRRIAGLGAGSHSVVITANVPVPAGGNDLVMLDWFWTGSNGYPLILLTNPRSTHSDDTAVAAYNTAVAAVVTQAAGDGMSVTLADAGPNIDPSKALAADGYHFSNLGHLDYAAQVKALAGL